MTRIYTTIKMVKKVISGLTGLLITLSPSALKANGLSLIEQSPDYYAFMISPEYSTINEDTLRALQNTINLNQGECISLYSPTLNSPDGVEFLLNRGQTIEDRDGLVVFTRDRNNPYNLSIVEFGVEGASLDEFRFGDCSIVYQLSSNDTVDEIELIEQAPEYYAFLVPPEYSTINNNTLQALQDKMDIGQGECLRLYAKTLSTSERIEFLLSSGNTMGDRPGLIAFTTDRNDPFNTSILETDMEGASLDEFRFGDCPMVYSTQPRLRPQQN